MASSWSNLPLDLILSIENKLQLHEHPDLTSFRSVCSHWHSAMPAPNPFPHYEVFFNKYNNIIQFIKDNNATSSDPPLSMQMPLPSTPTFNFFCSSNGWLVFITDNDNQILHLFNPIYQHMHVLPSLSPKKLHRHYNKFKTSDLNAHQLHLTKVIVSSSANGSVAVAGIVQINSTNDRRFAYCDGQKWNVLMGENKDIIDIALAGDGRFYAISEEGELYMLDKRTTTMRLKKIKVWLPKQILEPDPDIDPIDERIYMRWCGLEASGGSDLKIYGCCERYRFDRGSWIALKLEVGKLCGRSNNVSVACEAEWCCLDPTPDCGFQYFTPSLRGLFSQS